MSGSQYRRSWQNITWRVFATWNLALAVFVFAWISYAFSIWLDDIELAPSLRLAVIVGGFAARSFDHHFTLHVFHVAVFISIFLCSQ